MLSTSLTPPSPVQPVAEPLLERAGVTLRLKRDDLIPPSVSGTPRVSGNKWRKLRPNLRAARAAGHDRLLTFGGAYSHHLTATAAAARDAGLASVGLVRGDELAERPRNPALAAAARDGMELVFLSRAEYRDTLRALRDPATASATTARLTSRFGRAHVLPEGGSNALAAHGAAEIVTELTDLGPRDVVCCPVGSGGTLAGIAAALPPGARALGVAVLKGGEGYLESEVTALHRAGWDGRAFPRWEIDHAHHGGGYGRITPELAAFTDRFENDHGLRLERRYVAKALSCLYHRAADGGFPRGTRLTLVVTGAPGPCD
ncbi:1-aminocyclopropane-1-carboxylate deaminase/D-cysteine desulfhydrase, PLP-dependent ACC family [Streptomyces zhaozhouensis]|uniref:1-aminocyclopropane-1-carboxylate deaminase/D-cysteine desulfhydrase, PLP-dependent ACC family n=1 Tax=Streptomyces zhaozhouensis TaxID=1300267 RepID=A0A286DYU5_9ACTN|nr:pyridoxal-phosphate dependent enzyme [Streptomyces zhaozhouensis]SOD63837.1 1-aminocyclopropane-1-carboxylate deaminase/D-cysteine desulfhydrase, PLP-dependent ACC family [Streptomyces zhaozhouensis]